MTPIPGIKRAFRSVTRVERLEEEVDAELRFHIDMRAAQLAAAGMEPRAARAEALRQFGDLTRVAAECHAIDRRREREMRRFDTFDALRQDLRFALRQFRRSPGFTAVAVVLLALGVGATTAVFSVVSALLLRPLPYADPDRLVVVAEYSAREREKERAAVTTSYPNYLDWRAQARSFAAIATWEGWSPSLTGDGEPERLEGRLVHPDIFAVLQVRPLLGRAFLPEEAQPGSEVSVVLSYGLWQRRFGGDRAVLGRRVMLNARPRTVVGVLPPGFRAPPSLDADIWGSLPYDPDDECRTCRHHQVLARLKPGVTIEQARADMSAVAARLAATYPKQNGGLSAAVIPLRERLVGGLREPLWLLLGAAGLVLLIACANLSNLLIARGVARTREFAIRLALGADRARAVRQLLTESLVLAGLGGAAGLALAGWCTRLIATLGPEGVRVADVGVDWRVVTFTVALTTLTGIAFGMAPAVRVAAPGGARGGSLHAHLKEGARGSTAGAGAGLRSSLVVAQLALALTLLVGAGLLIKSFVRLQRVDPGFNPDHVLTLTVNLPSQTYPDAARRAVFFEHLVERLGALPGARGVGITSNIPISGNFDRVGFQVEGREYATDDDQPNAERYIVTPGYFQAMGIPLKRGRIFTPEHRSGTPRVVVIDDVLERELWPGGSGIGKRISAGFADSMATVIGVVGHVRHYGLETTSGGQAYVPFLQRPSSYMSLAVRTTGEPLALVGPVRREVRALDPNLPVFGISTMADYLAQSTASRRFIMGLLGAFAAIAVVIAAVGLYGVIAYAVSQRTHEIGIRMALGARPRDVLQLIVRQGLALAVTGVGIGVAAALAGGRVIARLLYGVSATDPAVLVGVPALLLAVAVLATYVPARRAAAVDPMISLRSE